jgi:hypothetical protein
LIVGRSSEIPSLNSNSTDPRVFQVRSHAQKHFLKAQKLGLGAALPPPKPRRGAVLAAHSPSSVRHDDNAVAPGGGRRKF